jgi:hypothetical protein
LRKSQTLITFVLAVLFLAVLACGPTAGVQEAVEAVEDAQAAVEDVGAVAEEVAEEAEEAVEGSSGDTGGGDILADINTNWEDVLDSYEMEYTMSFEGVDESGEPASMESVGYMAYQADPPAEKFGFSGTEDGEYYSSMGILIDGVMYTESNFGGEQTCMGIPIEEEDMEGAEENEFVPDVDEMLGEDEETEEMPDFVLVDANADVNGMPAEHYRAEHVTTAGMNDGTIDVWISKEYNIMLKSTIVEEGLIEGFGDGVFQIIMELISINEPIDFTPPADCEVIDFDSMMEGMEDLEGLEDLDLEGLEDLLTPQPE